MEAITTEGKARLIASVGQEYDAIVEQVAEIFASRK